MDRAGPDTTPPAALRDRDSAFLSQNKKARLGSERKSVLIPCGLLERGRRRVVPADLGHRRRDTPLTAEPNVRAVHQTRGLSPVPAQGSPGRTTAARVGFAPCR